MDDFGFSSLQFSLEVVIVFTRPGGTRDLGTPLTVCIYVYIQGLYMYIYIYTHEYFGLEPLSKIHKSGTNTQIKNLK